MKPYIDQRFDNDLHLVCSDDSRQIAGDRWLVRLRCEATIEIPESFWSGRLEEADLLEAVRSLLGGQLTYSAVKERNFVDEADRDLVMADLVDQVKAHLIPYLQDPGFPAKYFERCYREARQQCFMEQQLAADDQGDDEEGPADFSACFKD